MTEKLDSECVTGVTNTGVFEASASKQSTEKHEETILPVINSSKHLEEDVLASNGDSGDRAAGRCEEEGEDEIKLSKRQLRKLKKQEKWLIYKPQKRLKEKEKKRQRRQDALARGEDLGPSRKRLKLNTMAKSDCKVSVAIDCSLDSYMLERDIMKLSQQIQFSYSSNRRAENPLQFHICGITGQMKSRLDRIGAYKNWDVHSSEKSYLDLFDISRVVYLSSDSSNVLYDLDPEKVYIIGGLVDHNHHKGLCHMLAEEKGVSHAQLPISEYIDLKSRKVLTVNHVFEILLKYTETKDWQKAFFSVLPQRKGAQIKEEKDSLDTDAEGQGYLCDQSPKLSKEVAAQVKVEKDVSDTDSRGQGQSCGQNHSEKCDGKGKQISEVKDSFDGTLSHTIVDPDDITNSGECVGSHENT